MRLDDLARRNVVVWGAGREATAVLTAARARGVELDVRVIDDNEEISTVEGVEVLHGDAGRAALESAEVIVRSPGISRYRPDVAALAERGITFTTATNLWFAEGHKAIGVTGTKGKSTTSSLITHLLRAAGHDAELAGNIGRAPLGLTGDRRPEVWVLELSSFQCADLDRSPAIGVLTTLSPEHLDWHSTYDRYVDDKLNLFAHDPEMTAVVNAMNSGVREVSSRLPPRTLYVGAGDGVGVEGDVFVLDGYPLFELSSLQLVGDHNVELACLALTAVAAAGVDLRGQAATLGQALASFRPLDHRLSPIAEHDGVTYVDDGLATTPLATMAAIDAFADRPVTVLLGGHDRGLSYAELGAHIAKRSDIRVVTMPASGPRIAHAIRGAGALVDVAEASDLDDAVRIAAGSTPPGGVVLLSPAAASFGEFRDYEERSRAFSRAVHTLSPASDD